MTRAPTNVHRLIVPSDKLRDASCWSFEIIFVRIIRHISCEGPANGDEGCRMRADQDRGVLDSTLRIDRSDDVCQRERNTIVELSDRFAGLGRND